MNYNNLNFINNINIKNIKKNLSGNLSKKFSNLLLNIKNDIKQNKTSISVLNQKYKFSFELSKLKKFKKFKTIVIIGMGGSILGTEAIYGFLKKKIKKKVYFVDNINNDQLSKIKKKSKSHEVLFIIISKSGNTIETLSNAFSLNIFKNKAKNIIIISEKKNNFLFNLSKKLNLFYIEHKSHIGGRYSVLSEVGIVPSYLMGLNIKKLRFQLIDFLTSFRKKFLKESCIYVSKLLNSKQYNNLIFLNYSPDLEKFLFWLQQLIAESLGKKNKGFLPVISNVPKDHHSLLQLYLDGPKDKVFYIFSSKESERNKIEIKKNINKNNLLNKKTLGNIKDIQRNALTKALNKNNIPFREFKIKKNDEMTIGSLFSYFILETAISGMLSKINPYDQPAVEQVKIYTKHLLRKNVRK